MLHNNKERDIVVAALKRAAPYIRMYKRKTFVIKAGGEVFAKRESTRAFIEQIAILQQVGIRVVLVHGSGPQATQLAKELGVPTKIIHGRRVTDEQTLEVTKKVNEEVTQGILAACSDFDLAATAMNGSNGGPVLASKRPPVSVNDDERRNDNGGTAFRGMSLGGRENAASSRGGGFYNAGDYYSDDYPAADFTDVQFIDNVADDGGGMHNYHGIITLEQVTFSGNTANSHGGGLDSWFGIVTMNQVTPLEHQADRAKAVKIVLFEQLANLVGIIFFRFTLDLNALVAVFCQPADGDFNRFCSHPVVHRKKHFV